MNEAEARKILKFDDDGPVESIFDGGCWCDGPSGPWKNYATPRVQLDGMFEMEWLEALIWWALNMEKPL